MNGNNRLLCIFLCVILLLVVEGCFYEGPYPFRQDVDNIEKVEIYENDYQAKTRTLIVQLEESDGQRIVSELATMTVKTSGPNHIRDYGTLIIYITYADGEIEMIGLHNIGFVNTEGREGLTHYYFDAKSLYDLIVKYVDPALLPDVGKEYPDSYWNATSNAADPA